MRETGYYGIPGRVGGKVHVVEDGRPMCGARMHRLSQFQFCAQGIETAYIECKGCLRKVAPILREQWERSRKTMGLR